MQYWSITDPGCVRPQNQDTCQVEELECGCLLCVVCDGMGGARSGNVASTLACDVFIQSVKNEWKPSMERQELEALLRRSVKLANYTVFDQARQFEDFAGMGTTLVAAMICDNHASVVNVGDSRAYLVDGEDIRAITTDHSLVQMMVAQGDLTPEEARRYPGKNYITRAIGTEQTVECDIFDVELEDNGSLLLCSDGLSNSVDEQEILFEIVHGGQEPDCCRRLLDIAKNRGAPDNVTCVLVRM